jgi:hypothetical protein
MPIRTVSSDGSGSAVSASSSARFTRAWSFYPLAREGQCLPDVDPACCALVSLAREGSARTTWAYSSRSSRRQRSPGPPKVLALAAYPVWPSRSLARAHWRTIRSHTDIWDPDDPVQTIATNTGRLARL